MTAEIGVMNRLGVALAADSAVTIGGDARKVYSGADKLFQLSSTAPVGIMVYGSANFVDLPWETLIKTFRRTLGTTVYPHLDGYVDAFLQFIRQSEPLFRVADDQRMVARLVRAILEDIRVGLSARLDAAAEERDGLSQEDVAEILDLLIQERCKAIFGQPYLVGFAEDDLAPAIEACSATADQSINEVFGGLPISAERRAELLLALAHALIRRYVGPFLSGLVFAGFGEDEFLPSMVGLEIEERALGRPRIVSRTPRTLETTSASVVPFAQRDAVSAFLEGVEPRLREEMRDSVSVLFTGALQAITDELKKLDDPVAASLNGALQPGLDELLERLFAGWERMRRQHWSPVLDMVAALPKDELASVAEALVNLTKFRRRVTPVSESVGGPIDVALITKGDGFVWIRRKHYFQADLNPRAMRRLSEA
jgi:hypothetical protein